MVVKGVIIGKRITVGAAILAAANVLVHFYPEHSQAILAAATPVIFIAQLVAVNVFGVTEK